METLRRAVKNGMTIYAACPLNAQCEDFPDEDGGVSIKCGYLKGYLTDRKGLKVRCEYQENGGK